MTYNFTEEWYYCNRRARQGVSLAASRMGCKALLGDHQHWNAAMPCNPSIGGSARGLVCAWSRCPWWRWLKPWQDFTSTKMLNTAANSRPCPRAQADKELYSKEMRKTVENQENLTLRQTMIDEIFGRWQGCRGVRTATHQEYAAKAVIVTTGTRIPWGKSSSETLSTHQPNHSLASINLADNLKELGLKSVVSKTGTPPRQGFFYQLRRQRFVPGTKRPITSSYTSRWGLCQGLWAPCWLTYTNGTSHEIIQNNLHRAPMFTGVVKGVDLVTVRRLEDKMTCALRTRNVTNSSLSQKGYVIQRKLHVQGLFQTGLPEDVQRDSVYSSKGLENEMMRNSYAINDMVLPHQLRNTWNQENFRTLTASDKWNVRFTKKLRPRDYRRYQCGSETKASLELTEAQWRLVSGWWLRLATKGTIEPYRLWPVDVLTVSSSVMTMPICVWQRWARLTCGWWTLGLLWNLKKINLTMKWGVSTVSNPPVKETNAKVEEMGFGAVDRCEFLLRCGGLQRACWGLDDKIIKLIETEIKYEGYISKAMGSVAKMKRMERKIAFQPISTGRYWLDCNRSPSGSSNLSIQKPSQASRISGVNPADISILMVYLEIKSWYLNSSKSNDTFVGFLRMSSKLGFWSFP